MSEDTYYIPVRIENEIKDFSNSKNFDNIVVGKDDRGDRDLTNEEIKTATKFAIRTRSRPWEKIAELLDEVPTLETLFDAFSQAARHDLQRSACLVVMYLTGSRIHEIIPTVFKDGSVWNGVRQRDFFVVENGDERYLKIRTVTQKRNENRKDNPKYKGIYRKIFKYSYIPINEMYAPFLKIVEAYSNSIKSKDKNFPIFHNLTYDRMYNFCKRFTFDSGLHIYRHWRTTHLATIHGFTEAELRAVLGWSKTSALPTRYTHINERSLMGKMNRKLI